MLTYASQPADDWGPARKENQTGRYEILNQKIKDPNKTIFNKSVNSNGNINNAFESQTDTCSRL